MPIDFSNAWNTGVRIINETISLLPNMLLALLIFFAFLRLGAVDKSLARRAYHGGANIRESLC